MDKQTTNPGIHIIKIIAVGLIAFALYSVVVNTRNDISTAPQKTAFPSVVTQSLFTDGLLANNINADTIGFHNFSPLGKYFVMSVFKGGDESGNHTYLLDLNTQKTIELPGILERGFTDDSRVLQLFSGTKTILYFPDTAVQKSYDLGENIFNGSLSPDGKVYVVNTLTGIKKINLDTDAVSHVTSSQYDGAYAWFSDNVHILGFKDSGENLFEAGKGRTLGIWNVTDSTFSALPFSEKNIRSVEWVTKDHIARVNVGWDDGSHDYLYNLDTKTTTDVGDTSLALMASAARVDESRNLFAVIGTHTNDTYSVVLYKGDTKVYSKSLSEDEFTRQNLEIVDDHTLLYMRKQNGTKTAPTEIALVLYSFDDDSETVIRTFPDTFANLSLAPDHKSWVVSTGNTFSIGTL